MQKHPPGLYWYNGDATWGEKCLQLEVNDKNQWRHTVMNHPSYQGRKLPTAWWSGTDRAFIIGKDKGQWTRVEIDDPYMETDY
jgi:hypothetical protein